MEQGLFLNRINIDGRRPAVRQQKKPAVAVEAQTAETGPANGNPAEMGAGPALKFRADGLVIKGFFHNDIYLLILPK